MTQSTRDSIYEELAALRLTDPHTHINPHSAASTTLADLLGYHYYTELAHSAGMPKSQIEEPDIGPRELVRRLVENLSPLENTAQYRWLVEICRMFFGFDEDRIDSSNWESLYESAERVMSNADWPQMVLDQSNVEAVFLTNDFDDALSGFDTDKYIPCLRTDDLVFHLAKPETRSRLQECTQIELDGSLSSLRASLRQRFEHFVGNGARACAISLPPTFSPAPVSDGRADIALGQVLRHSQLADEAHKDALARRVFWTLAELCDEFGLPFDLMIGVNRGVYRDGVFQGQDLYDSRVSLTQYSELFNTFPDVKFPVSVLASVTNQELVSHAWIFPNVITNGHWWYSNTPSFIARDALARLEAVPQTKQIGYYSDAYKLEFVWPKFDMYRGVLADVLADHFVGKCGWNEERAVELGRRVLKDNVDEVFPRPAKIAPSEAGESEETWQEDATVSDLLQAGSTAALAGGAIGMVQVDAADVEEALPQAEEEPPETEDIDATIDDSRINETLSMETVEEDEFVNFETIIESPDDFDTDESDADNDSEPSDFAQDAANLDDTATGFELGDLPTVVETEVGDINATLESDLLEPDASDEAIDPVPSSEEVTAMEVGDVELVPEDGLAGKGPSETVEFDPESLDVGDLLGEDGDQPSDTQDSLTDFTLDLDLDKDKGDGK